MPLILKPISANLVKDFDLLGKSDPYCIIFVGNQKQRTRTCRGGGKAPIWSDTFQFNSNAPVLRVQVWDDDSFRRDDFIGQGSVSLSQFYQNPMRTQNEYVDLINRGKSAGRVLLSIQYQGPPVGGWNGGATGGWGGNQGGWGGQMTGQGGYGGQSNWGVNQGGYGGNQGGWGGYGGNQGGWGGNQGGWGGYSGNQGGWGGNQGGNQGGYGGYRGGYQGGSNGWDIP